MYIKLCKMFIHVNNSCIWIEIQVNGSNQLIFIYTVGTSEHFCDTEGGKVGLYGGVMYY